MNKIIFTSALFCLMISGTCAQELTLDQVLNSYFNSTEFDKLKKVNTIIMTGSITKQTVMPLKITKMRDAKYKIENDVADIYTCQSYDGQMAWEITTPWTGNSKPHIMQAEATKDIIAKSDFDGVLYNWKKKGYTAEFIGKEKCNNSEVYKIKLTRNDGNVENYYIDCVSFLLVKKTRIIKSNGKEIESISTFSDFREIEGIKFPFTNENFTDGQFFSIIEYDSIEVNKPIDPKIFEMPLK
jgi:hypothetical protein